jgi:hypothetical protein
LIYLEQSAKAGCFFPVVALQGRDGVSLSALIVRTKSRRVNTCVYRYFPYNKGMETKKMGRPPKPPAERQTARLEIRMTDAELKLVEKAGCGNTSGWAREVLVKAAKRRDK